MNRVFFILFLIAHWTQGQDVVLNATGAKPIEVNDGFELVNPQNNNQYIATQWSSGKLFYTNGTTKIYDSLNFDRFTNVLKVVINNKPLSIFPMGISGALIYTTDSTGTMLIVNKLEDDTKFLLVESSGNYLLTSYLVSSEQTEEVTFKIDEIYFVAKDKKDLVIKEHFVLLKQGNWSSFKLTLSTLSKLFKVDKKELQSIASNKSINLTNKNGLVALFKILNGQ